MAGRRRYRDFTVEDAWNGKGSEEVEEKRAQLFFGKKKKKDRPCRQRAARSNPGPG